MGILSQEQLISKYGYWGEHPEYTLTDWRYAVQNDDTRSSYWEWVENAEVTE